MRALLAAVACLFWTAAAVASAPTTALTGRVVSAGAPAGGVKVTATSPALQGERSTVTNARGRYWLTALPPGRYEVTFSRSGLQTLTKRAIVELARVARADANLEVSEDEDSVTSTALAVGVADTTTLTTHFSDETLDRLPIPRDAAAAAELTGGVFGPAFLLDGAITWDPHAEQQEALEQVTILRGGLAADEPVPFILATARTRAGGEEWFLSLRDTYSDLNDEHLVEGAVGGRIVPEKLWFFADAWNEGYDAKLTGQLGAQHNLMARYSDRDGAALAVARYIGTAGPRLTNEIYLSRDEIRFAPASLLPPGPRLHHEMLFARSTWVAGAHVLSAGGELTDSSFQGQDNVLFVNDRWLAQRWTVNAGVRYGDGDFSPRVGVSFDLRGDGRHAIIANFGDHPLPFGFARELTLGYATALGNTGSARVDALRRDFGPAVAHGAQATFTYSLFDRFHTGANYRWEHSDDFAAALFEHAASGWAGLDVPVGSHEFGVTALGRYHSDSAFFIGADAEVLMDVALRYSVPFPRFGLTLAADVTNLFARDEFPFGARREVRGWIRLRL